MGDGSDKSRNRLTKSGGRLQEFCNRVLVTILLIDLQDEAGSQ